MNLEIFKQCSLPAIVFVTVAATYIGLRLIRPLIGVGYPLLKTCKILKMHREKDSIKRENILLRQMAKYWACYGIFTFFEAMFDHFAPYIIPFYYQGKFFAMIALQCNWGDKPVCVILFDQYIYPVYKDIYPFYVIAIDKYVLTMLYPNIDSFFEKNANLVVIKRFKNFKDETKQKLTEFVETSNVSTKNKTKQ
ncbi:hypothetical protein COB52_04360 [Candidatus Kaiserbacteria bacterium]|nr:MAG: hypothetical protein COB52_04360 [Candidatus Kaiserbacteria bacterium]